MTKNKFNICLENPSWEMSIDEIWPDGDAPENPTEEDVANEMRKYGTTGQIIKDWNLDDSVEIWINGTIMV